MNKVFISLIILTSVMSLVVVGGWFGVGITGQVTSINTAVLDSLSVGVLWLIVITFLVFVLNLVLFRRNRSP